MMKKTLCLLLALALCLSLLPASALAADDAASEDRQLYFCIDGKDANRRSELCFEPGDFVGGFFCILSDGETLQRIRSGVVYTPDGDSAENAITLSLEGEKEHATYSFVWFNSFGAGRLVYTDETGVRYSMAAACALPKRGFSTAATLTEETYLPNDAYCPKDLSFYYVFRADTVVTSVYAVAAHGDDPIQVQAEVLSGQSNVCKFTLTSDLFSNDAFALEVYFTLQGVDKDVTAFISVRDPAPRFGFRLYRWDGSFSEELFRSVETDAGYRNRLGFFLNSGDESVLLDIASVTFLPAQGTAQDALQATKLANGIWKLDSVLPGQGSLQCTAQDGAVYTLPVDIALPSTGFFSERRRATETYLPSYDFDETAEEHVVWFLTANGFSAGDITGWAGESKEDFLDSVEHYITVEKVPWENSERFDIKLTIQDIPGCRLTVWPELPDGGGHMANEELEIINTKKLERLTPLDAPTDLAWAGDYPGDIRCKSGALFQDHLLWALYRVGYPAPLARRETAYSGHYDPDSWRVDDLLWRGYHDYPDRESGDYYFTVQAVGDEEQYKDSPVVRSETWTYTRPEAALAAPSDLHWEGQTACWSDEANRADDLYGYLIQFRCVAPETGAETRLKYTLTLEDLSSGGLKNTLQDRVKERLGSGTCYFRIQALSGDITRIRHGQWSEFNEVGTQLTAPSTVADALNRLLTEYQPKAGESTTLDETQANELKSAVAAKKDELERTLFSGADSSNEVAGKLQELEALVGGPAKIEVTGDAPAAITQSGVSIVGASLNGTADVTLKIDKVEAVIAETPINPAQYHNTIPFSMTLEGVSAQPQHQSLAVPVLITLPLPGSIHPSFLVLLHKIGDDWQEIFPYQILYNDELKQDCVRFTVTSFSDFAFAQRLSCGIQQLDAKNGQLRVRAADGTVASVVAAVYDGSGKQLGCTAAAAGTAGGTLTLDLPALKTGAAVRVFFLNKNGQPVCPAAEQNI